MSKRNHFGAALVALALAATAACGSSAGGKSANQTIQIAALMPTTGTASPYGKAHVAMLEHVIDETNSDGGIKVGDQTYDVKLTVFDDANSPETAQKAAREALNGDPDVIIGPFGSTPTSAVQSVIGSSGVPWMVNATVPGPTKFPNAFRTTQQWFVYDDALVSWLKAHPDVKTIAMTTDQLNTSIVDNTEAFLDDLKAAGITVVASEEHKAGDTDFRPIITKMTSNHPDAYVFRGYPGELAAFYSQVTELVGPDALKVAPMVLSNATTRAIFPDERGLQNMYLMGAVSQLDPFVASGNKRAIELSEALGDKTGETSAWAHDTMQVILEALREADSTSHQDVIKALKGLTEKSLDGVTLNKYQPQAGGRLFTDQHETVTATAVLKWDPKLGWIDAGQS